MIGEKLQYYLGGVKRELGKHWNDPIWWRQTVKYETSGLIHRLRSRTDGIDISSADWDNLLVLDACRADLFEETIDFDSTKYTRQRSKGSATIEWVQRNFTGREFPETVYITANPYVSRDAGDSFFKLVELWKTDFNAETGTVLPEIVAKTARDEFEDDKRLIVHFVQPHVPFLAEWWDPPIERNGFQRVVDEQSATDPAQPTTAHPVDSWEAFEMGLVERADIWAAYRENLQRVWQAVEPLLDELPGKTVVTSDHGELAGDRLLPLLPIRGYGHPRGVRLKALIQVPWLVRQNGPRRDIEAGATLDSATIDDHDLEAKLDALGYV